MNGKHPFPKPHWALGIAHLLSLLLQSCRIKKTPTSSHSVSQYLKLNKPIFLSLSTQHMSPSPARLCAAVFQIPPACPKPHTWHKPLCCWGGQAKDNIPCPTHHPVLSVCEWQLVWFFCKNIQSLTPLVSDPWEFSATENSKLGVVCAYTCFKNWTVFWSFISFSTVTFNSNTASPRWCHLSQAGVTSMSCM